MSALAQIRVIWAALLLGQIGLLITVAVTMLHRQPVADLPAPGITLGILTAVFILAAAVGLFVRNQIYKANWRSDTVTPTGYVTGNVVFLACCEGPAILSLAACFLYAAFWPCAIVSFLAMALFVVNFPHGQPMNPS